MQGGSSEVKCLPLTYFRAGSDIVQYQMNLQLFPHMNSGWSTREAGRDDNSTVESKGFSRYSHQHAHSLAMDFPEIPITFHMSSRTDIFLGNLTGLGLAGKVS